MVSKETNMWECECGTIEYGEFPPEECQKCWKLNGFNLVPEDMVESMRDHVLEHIRSEDMDDFDEEDEDEE